MTTIESNQKIGAIVAEDYRTAVVFKEYGIDFCCGGGRTLEDTCQSKNIPLAEIMEGLTAILQVPTSVQADYASWSMKLLCTYIEEKHHHYVRRVIPQIREFSAKVARVYGERYPEMIQIFMAWEALSQELSTHMLKEEEILFPYLKERSLVQEAGKAPFGSVKNPIQAMEAEHETAGQLMAKIRELSHNFTVPADGCTTFRVLYNMLEEFEEDLHLHVHLENHILFPKALALEQKVVS